MESADEAGALAAGRYFLELFSYVMRTGDLTEWDRVSGQSCEFCANTRRDVVAAYDAGGSFTGGELSIGGIDVVGRDSTLGYVSVGVQYRMARGAEVGADGSVVQEIPEEDGSVQLDIILADRGWTLIELRATEGPVS